MSLRRCVAISTPLTTLPLTSLPGVCEVSPDRTQGYRVPGPPRVRSTGLGSRTSRHGSSGWRNGESQRRACPVDDGPVGWPAARRRRNALRRSAESLSSSGGRSLTCQGLELLCELQLSLHPPAGQGRQRRRQIEAVQMWGGGVTRVLGVGPGSLRGADVALGWGHVHWQPGGGRWGGVRWRPGVMLGGWSARDGWLADRADPGRRPAGAQHPVPEPPATSARQDGLSQPLRRLAGCVTRTRGKTRSRDPD